MMSKRPSGKWGLAIIRWIRRAEFVASMAWLWEMMAGQSPTPATAGPPPCKGCCSRELVSTVWGFIAASLVALTLDDCGICCNMEQKFSGKVIMTIIMEPYKSWFP